MSNELNLTKEEAITEKPEVSGGGNKIVPITNAVVDPTANNTAVNSSAVNNSVANNPVASNPVAADTATVSNHSADAVDSVIASDSSAATANNSVSADLTQVSASTDDSAAADFADAAVNTNSSAAANFISAAANTNSSADSFTDHSTVSTADASASHDTAREKATSYRQPNAGQKAQNTMMKIKMKIFISQMKNVQRNPSSDSAQLMKKNPGTSSSFPASRTKT